MVLLHGEQPLLGQMRRFFGRHTVNYMNFGPDFSAIHPPLQHKGTKEMPISIQVLIDTLASYRVSV